MKTRIPIKKYELSEEMRTRINGLVMLRWEDDSTKLAKEYLKLEKHHEEETKFLIGRIEELEKELAEKESKIEELDQALQEWVDHPIR
jgi:hypothetical protein